MGRVSSKIQVVGSILDITIEMSIKDKVYLLISIMRSIMGNGIKD